MTTNNCKHQSLTIKYYSPSAEYVNNLIDKLTMISGLFIVSMQNSNKERKIINIKNMHGATIYVLKEDLIKNMQDLRVIHWNWINERNLPYNRSEFINYCKTLWREYISNSYCLDFRKVFNRFKNLEKRIPCSYALIKNKNFALNPKILLIRHHQCNLWSLPGGKREINEDYIECLVRELHEELGINVKVQDKNYIDSNVNKRKYRCYILTMDEIQEYKTLSPYEIADIQWFSLNKIPQKTKLLKSALREYLKQQKI